MAPPSPREVSLRLRALSKGSAAQEVRALRSRRYWVRLTPLWFLLPSLLVFALFSLYPFAEAIITSLSKFNLTDPGAGRVFIGLHNFRMMFQDSRFWGDLGRSFLFVSVTVLLSMAFGFYIASILHAVNRGKNLFRVIFLVPMTISSTIVALSFKFMLNYDFGVVNLLLESVGVGRLNFLGDSRLAMWSTVAVDIWQWTPFVLLVLLAGLESLPRDPYEAASLDGAGPWAIFWYITVPLMKRFLLVAALIRIMDAFRVYETIQLMTAGGPGTLSETLNVYIAKRGFSFFEMGPASAMAVALLLLITFIAMFLVQRSGAFTRG